MENIINLKNLRENMQEYAQKVKRGHSFVVFKKSKPLFKISPIDEEYWEEVIDFTKVKKGGIDLKELLKRLQLYYMDKIEKALNRLGSKVRQKIKSILLQIEKDDFRNLDLKKLKGRRDIFRIRKGDIRIIIHKTDNSIKILSIEHRSSKTYRQKRT